MKTVGVNPQGRRPHETTPTTEPFHVMGPPESPEIDHSNELQNLDKITKLTTATTSISIGNCTEFFSSNQSSSVSIAMDYIAEQIGDRSHFQLLQLIWSVATEILRKKGTIKISR
jgi:hypothetical protein